MRRVLYDTNFILDVIAARAPFVHASAATLDLVAMELEDFEDAVCVASAGEAGCTAIVTRNPRHFRRAALPALLPEALVAAEEP